MRLRRKKDEVMLGQHPQDARERGQVEKVSFALQLERQSEDGKPPPSTPK